MKSIVALQAVVVLLAAVSCSLVSATTKTNKGSTRAVFPYTFFPTYNPNNTCPDVNHVREKACTTGRCSANLLVGLYAMVSDCKLYDVGDKGALTPSGMFYALFADVIDLPDSNIDTVTTAVNPVTGTYHNDSSDPYTSTKVLAIQKDTAVSCCQACKFYNGQDDSDGDAVVLGFNCNFYQHFYFGQGTGTCFMYSGTSRPKCVNTTAPLANLNTIGAKCKSHVVNDPHLSGAHGTPYDFSGVPDQSFTLVTDERLNVNMKMTGYLDSRLDGAPLIKDGKALRTWIRELGFQWLEADGDTSHSLHLVARSGRSTSRGNGFLQLAELDGKTLPQLQVGESVKGSGGFILSLKAVEKYGSMDVDFYTLVIPDVLDMDIRLRPANHLLWTSKEAEVHFSVGFNSLERTSNIHGVLGQTYREDHAARAFEFSKLSAMLHHNVHADASEGEGFLDGKAEDYRTSSVMAADCKFNVFQKKAAAVSPDIMMVTH